MKNWRQRLSEAYRVAGSDLFNFFGNQAVAVVGAFMLTATLMGVLREDPFHRVIVGGAGACFTLLGLLNMSSAYVAIEDKTARRSTLFATVARRISEDMANTLATQIPCAKCGLEFSLMLIPALPRCMKCGGDNPNFKEDAFRERFGQSSTEVRQITCKANHPTLGILYEGFGAEGRQAYPHCHLCGEQLFFSA